MGRVSANLPPVSSPGCSSSGRCSFATCGRTLSGRCQIYDPVRIALNELRDGGDRSRSGDYSKPRGGHRHASRCRDPVGRLARAGESSNAPHAVKRLSARPETRQGTLAVELGASAQCVDVSGRRGAGGRGFRGPRQPPPSSRWLLRSIVRATFSTDSRSRSRTSEGSRWPATESSLLHHLGLDANQSLGCGKLPPVAERRPRSRCGQPRASSANRKGDHDCWVHPI